MEAGGAEVSLCAPPCTCDQRQHACSPPCRAHPELGGGLGNPGVSIFLDDPMATRPQDWAEPARTIIFGPERERDAT